MVVVILNRMITQCVIDVELKPDTSPISQFYVISCTHLTFDPSEVKFFSKLDYCTLDGFLRVIGQ